MGEMSLGTLQCSRVLQFGNVCVIMILLPNKTSPKLNVFRCQLSIISHASVTGWGSAGWDGSSVGLAVAASQGYMGLEYLRWFFFKWPLGWLCPFFCVASGPSICSQPDLYDNSLLFCLLVCICWGQLWLTSNSVSTPSHRHAVLSLPLWLLRSSGLGQELAPISVGKANESLNLHRPMEGGWCKNWVPGRVPCRGSPMNTDCHHRACFLTGPEQGSISFTSAVLSEGACCARCPTSFSYRKAESLLKSLAGFYLCLFSYNLVTGTFYCKEVWEM